MTMDVVHDADTDAAMIIASVPHFVPAEDVDDVPSDVCPTRTDEHSGGHLVLVAIEGVRLAFLCRAYVRQVRKKARGTAPRIG